MRIIYMGTPDFAVPALDALMEAGHEVCAVYSQPPRPAGRGRKPRPSPVQEFAEERNIPVLTPVSLRSAEEQAIFADFKADIAVVAAYGLLLPLPILRAPEHGCINIHGSLLPRWRGAAPIQRAIEAGDEETGVSIMQMEEGLDTGPVLLSASSPIGPTMTAGKLHDVLARLGAELIVEALQNIESGRSRAVAQPETGVLYARKIDKKEARLDWRLPAALLERRIRAFHPNPGAWFLYGDDRIKILAADVLESEAWADPGAVLDDELLIACGRRNLRPLRLQRSGKAPMDVADFLRGFSLPAGSILPLPEGEPEKEETLPAPMRVEASVQGESRSS